MMTNREMLEYMKTLAATAKPINDADYASARQIDAENYFFGRFDENFVKLNSQEYEAYCIKATAVERIDRAMELVSRHFCFKRAGRKFVPMSGEAA